MARISGVDLPNKRAVIALTYIYGIGATRSKSILSKAGIDESKRANDLDDQEVNNLRNIIEKEYAVEGDLRLQVKNSIKRLQEIGCYRGIRHRKGLPLRGQQTQTNAKTRKGKNRAVAGKKIATK